MGEIRKKYDEDSKKKVVQVIVCKPKICERDSR